MSNVFEEASQQDLAGQFVVDLEVKVLVLEQGRVACFVHRFEVLREVRVVLAVVHRPLTHQIVVFWAAVNPLNLGQDITLGFPKAGVNMDAVVQGCFFFVSIVGLIFEEERVAKVFFGFF